MTKVAVYFQRAIRTAHQGGCNVATTTKKKAGAKKVVLKRSASSASSSPSRVKKVTSTKKQVKKIATPRVVKATAKTPKKTALTTAVKKISKKAAAPEKAAPRKKVAATATPNFDMVGRRTIGNVSAHDRAASLENLVALVSEESQREHERIIEQSKFDLGVQHERRGGVAELPGEYGKDRVILLVVDPRFVFTYWEVTPGAMDEAARHLGAHPKLTLRFYDTTSGTPPERSPSWDIEVFDRLGNWYLRLETPEQTLVIDVGLKDARGQFRTISRSNYMKLPRPTLAPPGPIMWMVVGPDGEKVITSVEDYTEADLALLKRILGPYFFGLLMRGDFSSILGSSMEAVFQDVALLKHPGILPSSSPTAWLSSDSARK